MKEKINKRPFLMCWLTFIVCGATRVIEYYIIKTDQTVVAENIIHKILGIGILLIALNILNLKPKDIGFTKTHISGIGKGFLLGLLCFAVSYSIEIGILSLQGKRPHLDFYATGFSLNGGEIKRTALSFILLCIFFQCHQCNNGRRFVQRTVSETHRTGLWLL